MLKLLQVVLLLLFLAESREAPSVEAGLRQDEDVLSKESCLLYTSPSPRDGLLSRMPSSA